MKFSTRCIVKHIRGREPNNRNEVETSNQTLFRSTIQKAPAVSEIAQVKSILSVREFDLWSAMSPMDQRHSIVVMRRFVGLHASATNFEISGALLHDVGKTASNLGVIQRVIATLVGRVSKRFSDYHEHEQLGAQMLQKLTATKSPGNWLLVTQNPNFKLRCRLCVKPTISSFVDI